MRHHIMLSEPVKASTTTSAKTREDHETVYGKPTMTFELEAVAFWKFNITPSNKVPQISNELIQRHSKIF